MAVILSVVEALLLLIVARRAYSLSRNLHHARCIDVPKVFVPVNQNQILWLLAAPRFQSQLYRWLPTWIWQNIKIAIFGWEFREGLAPFQRFSKSANGDVDILSFLVVGLGKLEFWTADPEIANDMLTRIYDFEVRPELEFALGQYGHNVMTTNGDRWSRHRRIVTSVFDERIQKIVFEESAAQAVGLINEIERSASLDTPCLFDMLKKISIHVLLRTGMGTNIPWEAVQSERPEPGFEMTQTQSLAIAATNVVGLGIIPTKFLLKYPKWLPGGEAMRAVGIAKAEVHRRSRSLLDKERLERANACKNNTSTVTNTIIGKLLQASDESKSSSQALTDGEMISNLFVFAAAGFETTATTLAYALVLLARYPQWQDWLLEEIDELRPANDDTSLDYNSMFPRANRIMAFLLETLRLYSAVPHVHRETRVSQDVQTSSGSMIRLPPHTRVYVNSIALHILPLWRDVNRQSDPEFVRVDAEKRESKDTIADEKMFRPSRWINESTAQHAIYRPPKGLWLPWAMGSRVCPGQKMAQVEFTAVLVILLRHHRVSAVPQPGETTEDVLKRLEARLVDSSWVTVLQMKNIFDAKADEALWMRFSPR